MSDSGINQSTARSGRRPASEGVGLWRDAAVAAAQSGARVAAPGGMDGSAPGPSNGQGTEEPTPRVHARLEGVFEVSGTVPPADQGHLQGKAATSGPYLGHAVPSSRGADSDIEALLEFAVGLGALPPRETAAADAEPAPDKTAATDTAEVIEQRLPRLGRGVSTTFESALGLGSADSWYRPSERSVQRPAGSMPSQQSVRDRSTHV